MYYSLKKNIQIFFFNCISNRWTSKKILMLEYGIFFFQISVNVPLWYMVEKAMYCQTVLETWFAVNLTALVFFNLF
jgi:hypothetical protein